MSHENKNDGQGGEIACLEPIKEAQMAEIFGKDADPFEVHSFNMSDANESMLYVNAVGGEAEPLAEVKEAYIIVAFYYAKPISFAAGPNDTRYAPGEIINGVRLVLVDPDGRQVYTTSPTAAKIIGALHRTPLGRKRFNPPLRLRIGTTKTRSGFKTQTLTLMPTEIVNPVK